VKPANGLFNAPKLFWVLIFIFLFVQPCYAKKELHIPTMLQPWVDWVLYDKQEQVKCIPHYNNGDIYQCNWPSELEISLDDQGGEFRQSWLVNHESRVILPGNNRQWPRNIQVDGKRQILVQKEGRPSVLLMPGAHEITGGFTWHSLPENLQIPVKTGLLSLTVNGEKIKFPNLDAQGRLWLKRSLTEEKIENRLKIETFRLIEDSIPPKVLVYFTLDVAGSARELRVGPLYPAKKFIPLSLKSPLPAKLEQDGRMLIQVRPGQYNLSLTLRHEGPLEELSFPPYEEGLGPNHEIWSFRTKPDLRIVEIKGVPPIDPFQTSMPQNWHQYPAYRLSEGDTMKIKEIKRGDPKPAPDQLTLNRDLWLRFDGSGYTIQDKISGRKNTNWRLEIDPSITLGRVKVDGTPRLITQQKGSDRSGIELRNGLLNLTADSIYQGKIAALPATGWDHDFQQVKARLRLPPGWKLIHAAGIDNIPRTWVKRWTLLDFFVVLIFTIALAKLFSKPLAGIAFLTMILTYHEPYAPRYIWLALLIGFALLRYLPGGTFKRIMKVYQGIAILALIVIVIPYAIDALRVGIYPQLAKPWTSMTRSSLQQKKSTSPLRENRVQEMKPASLDSSQDYKLDKEKGKKAVNLSKSSYYDRVMQHDPNTLTQTGPGLPRWVPFETIHFNWSGPVPRDQMISFFLIGPKTNLVLSFVRVSLILLLALGMLGFQYKPKKGLHFSMTFLKIFPAMIILFTLLASPSPGRSSEIPSPQILDELQKRLLEKEDCYPFCADISDVAIRISHDKLSIDLYVDAQTDVVLPIPSHVKYWLPKKVMIGDTPASGLVRKKNNLWVLVPAGKHIIGLSGPIRKQNTLQLPFPLKPHRVTIKVKGWSVEGVNPDGSVDGQLQFKRIAKKDSKQAQILETGILPAFAIVERTLLIGLDWKIRTTVKRLSPEGSGIMLDIPLLPGESVTTQGIHVKEGMAKINLGARQTQLTWESFLKPSDQILLKHHKTSDWSEIWKVDVSPIFHLTYEGIPVILHKTGNRWYPTWHPWPGETLSLNISRPAGVKGQTLTIESSHLELRPGRKTTSARMILTINSSQGGQHRILLPLDTKLQEVKIKGKIQPIRKEGQSIVLPITPGHQNIELKWLETGGMTTRYLSSKIDLGTKSVNASIDVYLPPSRWPLFIGGEQLTGPAILFWSVLIIIVVVAFGLSKTGWTPLRFYQWVLLGIGMSMSNLAAGIMVAGWLIALDFKTKAAPLKNRQYNLVQIGIVALTITGIASLVYAISMGLLGHPDMNILGNGSNHNLLRWYQDVSDKIIPRAWIFSIPMWTYRAAMLLWALWVSFWLVGIIKWGWQQFISPTIWYKLPPKIKPEKKTGKKTGKIDRPQ
jgi:hypothetical protein